MSAVHFCSYRNRSNKHSFNALVAALDARFPPGTVQFHVGERFAELAQALEPLVANRQRVLLAFSFPTTQYWNTEREIRTIRERFGPGVFCVAGGPHPSADPEGTLALGFDCVALGEGEETVGDLVEALGTGETGDGLACIQGLALPGPDKVVFTPRRRRVDIDRYPAFPRSLRLFGPIEITRGCPHACHFCQLPRLMGTRPRHRSVEHVRETVRWMVREGLRDIRTLAPNALAYGSRDGVTLNVPELSRLLVSVRRELNGGRRLFFGSFPSEVRPEHVTEETITLLREHVDNTNLVIGAQSGSDRVLRACRRGHTIEDVFRAVDLARRAGFQVNIDFIFGLPCEEDEDLELSLDAIDRLIQMGSRIHAHSFMPLPQTHYARATPRPLPQHVQLRLRSLVSDGKAYGDWQRQAREAPRIASEFTR